MDPITNLRHFFDRSGGGRPDEPVVRGQSEIVDAARLIVGRSTNAALLTDNTGAVVYMNQAAEDLIGLSATDAEGRQCGDLLRLATLDKRRSVELPIKKVLGEVRTIELPSYAIVKASDGKIIAVQGSVAPVLNKIGQIVGTIIQLFDVSRLSSIPDRLEDPATSDGLTGLVDREELEERVKRSLKRAQEQNLTHILMYVDIDRFRQINETFGRKLGDEVLKAVAFTMRSRTRDRDTVARLRGDEFALLLENCKLTDGSKIAEGLLEAIHNLNFKCGSEIVKVGISIGVTQIDQTTEHFSDTLAQTDAALYRAKQKGKSSIEVFGKLEFDDIPIEQESLGAAGLAKAMEEHRFHLFLQPILALNEKEGADFFEVFTKLKTQDGEMLGPSYFISDAERHHLMPVLDRHIIKLAFESYRDVYGDSTPHSPAVWAINLSGASLHNRDFVEFIREMSKEYGVPPKAICFEITETTALNKTPQAAQFIHSLKGDGYCFSLDDFGPALGSFGALKGLTVDFVKIDGSFVSEITRDRISRGTVKAIQYLCNILGVKTIAESVESEDVIASLRECGVNYAQGYALGAPVSLAVYRKLGSLANTKKAHQL
jgi:diguanylate cyclase (GGDEF)-like protein/PAS domain S-box-containing protein